MAAAAFTATLALASAGYAADQKAIPHLNVEILTIPDSRQRYDTAGDWRLPNGRIVIKVSRLSNPDYELLVAIHELIEARLCQRDGVSDRWDRGPGKDEDEPGDDPKAPYHEQHMTASRIERFVAKQIGVNWAEYEKELESQ
jgi:hypothetical protein